MMWFYFVPAAAGLITRFERKLTIIFVIIVGFFKKARITKKMKHSIYYQPFERRYAGFSVDFA